ncbi:MAG: adenine deaminase [Desulfobacterales bacterium]|nr:adenine deaminase [Desulfobacterales bacterium]
MQPEALLAVARGDRPADLLLTNARVVNVYSNEIVPTDIAIAGGMIAGLGPREAGRIHDLKNRFVAPGFIDAHVHIESAMAIPSEFARAVLPRGTTAVVADPHEIANVMGTAGLNYMLAATEGQPLHFFFTLPSCVPSSPLETAGARLEVDDLAPYIRHPRIVGLAEMMNFPGAIGGDEAVRAKIALAAAADKPVDGHAPEVSGQALHAYRAAGIGSEHECASRPEALEKLRLGLHIMVREGTGAKNLKDLVPLITPANAHRFMWCTDDRHAHDLLAEGHIDVMIREAIQLGLDPVTAFRIATLNPATYFKQHRIGAIAPGKRADLVVLSDLEKVAVDEVYRGGQLAAAHGRTVAELDWPTTHPVPPAMRVDPGSIDLRVKARGRDIRVIEIVPDQIITRSVSARAGVKDGWAVADPGRDLLKIAVIERHRGTGRAGIGFVRGMGLVQGALASSVAHDAHNIITVGVDDGDMLAAVDAVASMGGGLAVVSAGRVQARLALPIAGLMSPQPMTAINQALNALQGAAQELGCPLRDPFMTLAFLALPVIPALKITDRGLVDVERFRVVSLFPTGTGEGTDS